MENIKSEIGAPLYQQLSDTIKEQIRTGQYQAGDKIPSESQLSELYSISRITVRNALQHLVDEHILIKKKGKGTYVAQLVRVEEMSAGNSFTRSCEMMGAVPSTRLISLAKEPADKKIAEFIGIQPDEMIICIKRLRLIDDMAAIFEVDYFKKEFDILLRDDFDGNSLLMYLREKTGHRAARTEDLFDIRYATKEHAKYLECTASFPLLCVSQKVFGEDSELMYFNEQYIRSDRYKYAVRTTVE